MSEFELIMVLSELSRTITEQFEFWMGATFAVVVVCYTAGQKLGRVVRGCIAFLYLVASAMFYFRYLDAVDSTVQISQALGEIGTVYVADRVELVSLARRIVMFGGSLFAMVLIFWPPFSELGRRKDGDT
jgi:hypothetical protein